jgi:hypothetical protein
VAVVDDRLVTINTQDTRVIEVRRALTGSQFEHTIQCETNIVCMTPVHGGHLLATGHVDGRVHVYDVQTGVCACTHAAVHTL